MTQLTKKLMKFLNENCLDEMSGTHDFLLAEYLMGCLKNWSDHVKQRDRLKESIYLNALKFLDKKGGLGIENHEYINKIITQDARRTK